MTRTAAPFRYRSRRRRTAGVLVLGVAVLCVCGFTGLLAQKAAGLTVPLTGSNSQHRAKRQAAVELLNNKQASVSRSRAARDSQLNCTPRSIEEFPETYFSLDQRQDGWVGVHIFVCLYIFGALAIVCDDYFVASLEYICEVLGLQSDVAGATFMAAGSSAPELFTSFIGLFFADSDIGIGTIVGSAVFNILFIIGICGLGAGMVVYLTWWPLARDSAFYTLTVIALILVIYDEKVHWYESVVFLVMYMIYVLIMYFNPKIGDFFIKKVDSWKSRQEESVAGVKEGNVYSLNVTSDLGSTETDPEEKVEQQEKGQPDSAPSDSEYESPLVFPDGVLKRMFWSLMLPVSLLFYFTIPDCRRPGCFRRLYILTFINSIIWISGLSYLMVWMVTIVGDTFNVPDTVMGLTLLAAGTSIPDALASLFVARDGYGDMAVSNSIGSNVFDILVGLGLPWFIQTVIVETNDVITIRSAALTFSAVSLLATVVFLLAAVVINRWRLTRPLGVVCLVVYVVFLVFAILYELNVFTDINPPACPRE